MPSPSSAMHPLSGSATSSKRRRSVDPKSSRRFSVKDMKKKEIIPLSAKSPPSPRKSRRSRRRLSFISFIAIFFLFLTVITIWRRRVQKNINTSISSTLESTRFQPRSDTAHHLPTFDIHSSSSASSQQQQHEESTSSSSSSSSSSDHGQAPPHSESDSTSSSSSSSSSESAHSSNSDGVHEHHQDSQHASTHNGTSGSTENTHDSTENHSSEHPESQGVHLQDKSLDPDPPLETKLPESIEFYTRSDFKDGLRPICRVTHPFVLSNGTILFPDWMERHRHVLQRCNIGSFGFYTPEVPPTAVLKETNNVDVDFALTMHLERFQEPTHEEPIYLTEHILKSAYLFEIFGGTITPIDSTNEKRCIETFNNSDCSKARPPRTGLKPAIFVPFRLEHSEKTGWAHHILNMMGTAYGAGDSGLVHLNTSDVIVAAHEGKKDGLIGTRFRSMMSMDGMFRHIPIGGLRNARLFSERTGVHRRKRPFHSVSEQGKCKLSITIAANEHLETIKGASDLQDKLKVMTKFAMPNALIGVSFTDVSHTAPMEKVRKRLKDVDIFIAGSGSELNNMGFLRRSASVLELTPFGITPIYHKSFANAMGIPYDTLHGKPNDEIFKTCIEGEVFQLKKQGKDTPKWMDPLLKAWEKAVADYMLTGKSDFDVSTAEQQIRNYHSRICTLKQPIEVNLDEVARRVLHLVKEKCGTH